MVRTIKELFAKADDPFLAVLSYRDTAGVTGFSPAQLLLGCSLRTRLPKTTVDCLDPKWPAPDDVKCQDEEVRGRQKKDFDRRHAVTVLPPLQPGDTVWVRDIKDTASVLSPASKPRSYVVETPNAVLVRNRIHLVPYLDTTMSQLGVKTVRGTKSRPRQQTPRQPQHRKSPKIVKATKALLRFLKEGHWII
ncbi:uncharacterized protein [Dermacentor andersoni]|uniref:uncharacterized protein n=1 Tax=Dermacentor andersoni TaxID=34620 RepID=UPI003B3AB6DB